MIRWAALSLPVLALALVAPCRAREPGAGDDADRAAVVKGNNHFALRLYNQLTLAEGNLVFSPYSVSTALAMTYAGARGQTAAEMARTLHFTLDQKRLHPAFASLRGELNAPGKKRGYQLSVANALWGQKGAGLLPGFLNTAKTHYRAGLTEVDFKGDAEAARKAINDWAEKETGGKIKDLYNPGVGDERAQLVLTSAVYCKGDWASKFKKEATRAEPFLTPSGKVNVPMMHQTGDFGYLETEHLQVLEMPYAGKELAMVVLLPTKAGSLHRLEREMTRGDLARWLKGIRPENVRVALPRFKCTRMFRLNSVLADLGMPRAFTAEGADFSGMNGTGPRLFLSAVISKALVEVNEEGTEAAAGTAVEVKKADKGMPVFRADRPFVFLIRDNRTGSILFLGRVVNPGA